MIDSDQVQERSLEIANSFAVEMGEVQSDDRQMRPPFELARKLKALGGTPGDHKEAVGIYCRARCLSFDDFWEEFLGAWDDVKFPDFGNNGLRWAFEMALREPIPLNPRPESDKRQIVYSMCWHLAERNDPHPFLLAREPLAELLGISPMSVCRIVKWLLKRGYVKEYGKYRPKKTAQQYVLLP